MTRNYLRQFMKQRLEIKVIINKLQEIDSRFLISSQNLSDAIKRVGSSASDASISLRELTNLVTKAN